MKRWTHAPDVRNHDVTSLAGGVVDPDGQVADTHGCVCSSRLRRCHVDILSSHRGGSCRGPCGEDARAKCTLAVDDGLDTVDEGLVRVECAARAEARAGGGRRPGGRKACRARSARGRRAGGNVGGGRCVWEGTGAMGEGGRGRSMWRSVRREAQSRRRGRRSAGGCDMQSRRRR